MYVAHKSNRRGNKTNEGLMVSKLVTEHYQSNAFLQTKKVLYLNMGDTSHPCLFWLCFFPFKRGGFLIYYLTSKNICNCTLDTLYPYTDIKYKHVQAHTLYFYLHVEDIIYKFSFCEHFNFWMASSPFLWHLPLSWMVCPCKGPIQQQKL